MKTSKPKILLHVCCPSCSPYVIKVLSREFIPTIYYYNPNIHPFEEYEKRRLDLEGYIMSLGYEFIEGNYDDERWHGITRGLEHEYEGGARCEICFEIRMNQVALYAIQHGFEWFATTLTVSPHKNSRTVNHICQKFAEDYGVNFYKADFKKHDGFKISMKMAKELDFYRQDYCGCTHSLQETQKRKRLAQEIAHQAHQMISPVNT